MNEQEADFPKFFTLTWLLFFRPNHLRNRLERAGIETPNARLSHLARSTSYVKWVRKHGLFHTTLGLTCPILVGLASGYSPSVIAVALVSAGSFVFAIYSGNTASLYFLRACLLYPMLFLGGAFFGGVAWPICIGAAMALGYVGSASFDTPSDESQSYTFRPLTLLTCIRSALANALFLLTLSFAGIAVSAVVYGILYLTGFDIQSHETLLSFSLRYGVAFGVAKFVCWIYAWLYPWECIIQAVLYCVQRLLRVRTLAYVPVLYNEQSHMPHPLLARHLLLDFDQYGDLPRTRAVLQACAVAPGQRWVRFSIGSLFYKALANDLAERATIARFREMTRVTQAEVLGAFTNAYVVRYLHATTCHIQNAIDFDDRTYSAGNFADARRMLDELWDTLERDQLPGWQDLCSTVLAWKALVRSLERDRLTSDCGALRSPYRPGEALSPERGGEVFRGRDAIVTEIARIVSGQDSNGSVVLTAPRRYGKTSLLRMLPVLIPETLFVFFDLQDNPTDSAHGFFTALARRTQEASEEWGQVKLPSLPDGSPFESARHWFELLETNSGGVSIVFCFDEFERLEKLFPGDERELHKLMGLFRSITQYHHRVRLLISGAARFSELGRLWDDHFVNVQELTLERLDHDTTRQLLMCPVPTFPSGVIGEAVADEIFNRTGGQPFLLQVYGDQLVRLLNEEQRRLSGVQDVAAVEQRVQNRWKYFFRDLYEEAPPHIQETLVELAHDRTERPDQDEAAWLRDHDLLNEDGSFAIPSFAAWLCTSSR